MVLLSSSRWLLNAFHCDVQEAVIALSNNIQISNSKGPNAVFKIMLKTSYVMKASFMNNISTRYAA